MTTLYHRLIRPGTAQALDALHAAGNTTGTTPDDDIDVLAGVLLAARAKRILQFGTFLGGSGLVLADIATQNGGPDGKLVTVDPNPEYNKNQMKFAQIAGLAGAVTTIDGTSTDPAILARLARTQWDAIYLDTTHQFDHTYAEIRAIAPLCGPQTLFLFHDASTHAADNLDVNKQGGVRRAIIEYCLLNARWQYFIFEKPAFGQFGIGLMQKKA